MGCERSTSGAGVSSLTFAHRLTQCLCIGQSLFQISDGFLQVTLTHVSKDFLNLASKKSQLGGLYLGDSFILTKVHIPVNVSGDQMLDDVENFTQRLFEIRHNSYLPIEVTCVTTPCLSWGVEWRSDRRTGRKSHYERYGPNGIKGSPQE